MRSKTYPILWIFFFLLFQNCGRKESALHGISYTRLCRSWVLETAVYRRGTETYNYIPYEDVKLSIFRGGRFSVNDRFSILGFRPKNGTGIPSADIQMTYGSWEFTNESNPENIVFNKGINTYNLYEIKNKFDRYIFSNPEFLFRLRYDADRLELFTTDPYLIYYYGYWLNYDFSFFFDYTIFDSTRFTPEEGSRCGNYFGYALGYQAGAKQAALESSFNPKNKAYLQDPYNVGYAHGIVQYYKDVVLPADSVSTRFPEFKNAFDTAFERLYSIGYDEALSKIALSASAGSFMLSFSKP